jgi:hypothetical protein
MRIARMSCSFKLFLFWVSLALCLQTAAAVQVTAQERRGHRRGGEAKADEDTKKEVEKKETEETKEKKEDRYLLLRDGDVYPVVGPVQRETDILTRNGVILCLGRDLEAPEGCEMLDVAGMRVYP